MAKKAIFETPDLPEVNFSDYGDVRYLHLGTLWVQGSMLIDEPYTIELEYVQRMMAGLLFFEPLAIPKLHAMQLGLGAATLTKFCYKKLRMTTTAIEINPQVIAINAAWFHLPEEAEVVRGDAADWLQQAERSSVRLLHVDLYDHEAAAPVLDDVDFYRACRAVLEDGGLMSVNLFGRHASFHDSIQRIAAAFGADQVWSLRPTREGNTVVVAGRRAVVPSRDELQARAGSIEKRFGSLNLPAKQWLRMVRPYATRPAPNPPPT